MTINDAVRAAENIREAILTQTTGYMTDIASVKGKLMHCRDLALAGLLLLEQAEQLDAIEKERQANKEVTV